jgi:dipeptidyl aminopeptidase/acylaminoacyl peptidase
MVGISDLVTFLEGTGVYRQEYRRAEYGDERDPRMREHLRSISPLARIDRITRPVFVAHGANDPRVPVREAEQICSISYSSHSSSATCSDRLRLRDSVSRPVR